MTSPAQVDLAHLESLAGSLVDAHEHLLDQLILLRKKHGLTQEVVAERMGVSQPTVAAFERYDANPTLSSVRRYALAVGGSIKHTVEDSCCSFETAFDAILETSTIGGWKKPASVDWSWVDGPIVVTARVDA